MRSPSLSLSARCVLEAAVLAIYFPLPLHCCSLFHSLLRLGSCSPLHSLLSKKFRPDPQAELPRLLQRRLPSEISVKAFLQEKWVESDFFCSGNSGIESETQYMRRRKIVEHIFLLKANEDLSDEEEKGMLDYLYTVQYLMGGIVAISLGGDFQHNVTRFTLPILSLAFNKSSTLLAASVDDEGIKLTATTNGSISSVLKGHKGSVTGLAFDPTSEYLASVDGIGIVIYWELSSGKPIHTLKGIAPDSGSDDSVLNIVSSSLDGEMLPVPGLVLSIYCTH